MLKSFFFFLPNASIYPLAMSRGIVPNIDYDLVTALMSMARICISDARDIEFCLSRYRSTALR